MSVLCQVINAKFSVIENSPNQENTKWNSPSGTSIAIQQCHYKREHIARPRGTDLSYSRVHLRVRLSIPNCLRPVLLRTVQVSVRERAAAVSVRASTTW